MPVPAARKIVRFLRGGGFLANGSIPTSSTIISITCRSPHLARWAGYNIPPGEITRAGFDEMICPS